MSSNFIPQNAMVSGLSASDQANLAMELQRHAFGRKGLVSDTFREIARIGTLTGEGPALDLH